MSEPPGLRHRFDDRALAVRAAYHQNTSPGPGVSPATRCRGHRQARSGAIDFLTLLKARDSRLPPQMYTRASRLMAGRIVAFPAAKLIGIKSRNPLCRNTSRGGPG